MKKIIVIPLYGIGDVLMTTPALKNLKERLDVEITYLHMFKATYDILAHNPYVSHNIHFPFLDVGKGESLRFLLRLRKKYQVSINFYPSNKRPYNLAAFLAGSPVRIGHRYVQDDMTALNFLKNQTLKEDDNLHCVEENYRLLAFLGIEKAKPYPLELYLTEGETAHATQWIQEKKLEQNMLVGIHPGTSSFKNHDKRRWPKAFFARLIDRLALEFNKAVFLLFGGPEEKALREEIISMVGVRGRTLSVDSLSIRRTAALIGKCRLFISNDSGLMHIAAAMRVPTVAMFGPTNPVWVKPWAVRHRIVRLGLSCSPCFRYSSRPLTCIANIDYACMNEIIVDQVFRSCIDLIEEENK
jgi:lipopolysaccharide heptosyltransferase II